MLPHDDKYVNYRADCCRQRPRASLLRLQQLSTGILLIQYKNTAAAVQRWSSAAAAAFKRSKIQKTRKKSKICKNSKICKFHAVIIIQRYGIIYHRTAETSSHQQEVIVVCCVSPSLSLNHYCISLLTVI